MGITPAAPQQVQNNAHQTRCGHSKSSRTRALGQRLPTTCRQQMPPLPHHGQGPSRTGVTCTAHAPAPCYTHAPNAATGLPLAGPATRGLPGPLLPPVAGNQPPAAVGHVPGTPPTYCMLSASYAPPDTACGQHCAIHAALQPQRRAGTAVSEAVSCRIAPRRHVTRVRQLAACLPPRWRLQPRQGLLGLIKNG